MSEPKMYTWRDADAPTLNGEPGSLIQVLRKCLVEGFSSGEQESTPPGAGWEIQADDPPNRGAFRSLNPNAAGHWYYFDDTGDYDGVSNDGNGAEVAALLGAESFTGWDENGDPELTGIFGDNGTISAQFWPKSDDATTARGWIVIADDRTCYVFCMANRDTEDGWDLQASSIFNQARGISQSTFGDYRRFDAYGGSTASGIVCADNRTPRNNNAGAFAGGQPPEGTPETADDVADTGITGAQAYIKRIHPRAGVGSAPNHGEGYVGPLLYERHWIGQSNVTACKGTMRGLRVPLVGASTNEADYSATFPDITKLYGELDMGLPLGVVFYIAGRHGSDTGLVPYLFLQTNWDNAD